MCADQTTVDTEDLLAQVPLFSGLSRRETRHLAELCLPKRYPAGTHIIDEGKPGLGLFIVTSGKLEVYRGRGENKRTVAIREAGTVIGEMSLVDNQPRVASVLTLEPTECLLITYDSFQTLVKKHPSIAWSIVPVITQRFRQVEQQLLDVMEHAAEDTGGHDGETAKAPASKAAEDAKDRERAHRVDRERLLDLLRAEYALLVSGAEGIGRSAGIMESFLRSMARETGLEREQPLDEVMKAFPKALKEAMSDVLSEGEKLPERLLATFRRELHRRDPDRRA